MQSSSTARDARWVVLDRVPSMLAYWDRDLRCRFANRAYEVWFGVDPDALVGQHLQTLLGPALFALNEPYARAALNGQAQSFERVIPGPAGVLRKSLAHYLPDVVDGEVVGMVVQVTDVTRLHEAQSALRDSEARLRASFSAMTEGLVLHQHDGRIVDANPAAGAILGLSHDQLMGRTPMDPSWRAVHEDGSPFPGEDHPAMLALRTRCAVAGQVMGVQSSGFGLRWISVNAVPVRNEDTSSASAVVATFVDITELHQTRERLRALAQEQHTMLDNDMVGIVRLKARRMVWLNRALSRMFGYQADELRGQTTRLLYPDDQSFASLGEAAYAELQAGLTFRRQVEFVCKDGSLVWIDLAGSLLAPDSGESLWLLNDITPLKRAEAQRLEADRLAAENTQMRELSLLKSQFIANMSHELRTPLNAIIGFAQLLEPGLIAPGSPKHGQYLRQIGDSGRHLLKLIDDVLTFARVESGRFQFRPEPVIVAALAQEAVDLIEAEAARKGIKLRLCVDPSIGVVHLDPMRLKQVIVNYLSNAVKFTPAGGSVELRVRASGAENFVVEVEDTGIGIDADDVPRLFIEFQQLSVGSSKRYAGAGLGLAVTRRLVEAQGGYVGVRSTPGVGSVFHAELPIKPP